MINPLNCPDENDNPTSDGVVYKSLSFLGFPSHKVGNDGSVWSFHPFSRTKSEWKLIKQRKHYARVKGKPLKDPYYRVGLGEKRYLAHRLVLMAFVGPCPKGMECRHLDGNRLNNHLKNLKWGTKSRNQRDRLKHGADSRGTKSGNNKLTGITEEDIRFIRRTIEGRAEGISVRKISKSIALFLGVRLGYVLGAWRAYKTGKGGWSWLK